MQSLGSATCDQSARFQVLALEAKDTSEDHYVLEDVINQACFFC